MPHSVSINRLYTLLFALMLWSCGPPAVLGQTQATVNEAPPAVSTLETLESFFKIKNDLLLDIKKLNEQIKKAETESEKNSLLLELNQLKADLRKTERNFENIAAGIDISSLRLEPQQKFNLQEELFALLKPALDEMKEMTSHVRQKSDLRERILYYEEQLSVLEQAIANVDNLQEQSKGTPQAASLKLTAQGWKKQRAFVNGELQAAKLQLDKLIASEVSITEASHSYFKSFFQKRGLFLTQALLAVLGVILLSKLTYSAMQRYIPGFRRKHRSFRVRLVELLHRMITVLLVILGPMIVFYLAEDWVLFSLGILLLLGMAWTLRQAVPRYWHQVQLFLNIGAVREGERILMGDLPWQVQQINIYCTLINPVADLTQRVPIAELVELKSRPSRHDEPWFPCKKGDWVILNDGVRGTVTGISPELISLVERGGAQITYKTGDFLANSPRNLATNFRLKEIIGISYAHQSQSTSSIPETLQGYVQQRIENEGYGEHLLNLRVEFAQANSSSLDLAVIADFKGELGDLYNRLRRAIQRWCVDACTEYGWEIPFPQMTLHGELSRRD